MLDFLVQRVAISIVTFFLITLIVFAGVRMIPGDPARVMAGTDADEAGLQEIREKYGLNDPIPVQYVRWLGLALRGDLGESLWTRRPVLEEIGRRLSVTLEIAALATLFALTIALPIGVLSATRQDTVWDYVARSAAILGLSVPGFWLATLVIVLPAIWWGWRPLTGFTEFSKDALAHVTQLILPAFILGIAAAAALMRLTRGTLLEVLRQDYVRTAWAKGLSERRVVLKHTLRNGIIPVVSLLGTQIPQLLGGTVIIETIFGLPGMGRFLFDAINQRDYPVIQGVNLVVVTFVVFINLTVDALYAVLDPRIRY